VSITDDLEEVGTGRAAIDQFDRIRKQVLAKSFDDANADPFVSKQDVADPENKDRRPLNMLSQQ
jgi:hypothetical protein